ncbi:hypothetical protein KFL_000660040 [Klebsormidium nitens]|uniref:Uncharacterized protein n=1 Tax=Klebsormidium nitens TaxID=105231 RepID=A0A1Y1HQK9_KLENI|nr:hypothetical protein KFL_000660040 [Klebsormidium nitens]|eukprot:GAQ80910.1 hypothetical protein KFL_000660040 [Klebsormidium nitens]
MATPFSKSRRKKPFFAGSHLVLSILGVVLVVTVLQLQTVAADNTLQDQWYSLTPSHRAGHARHILQTVIDLSTASSDGPKRPLAVSSRTDPLDSFHQYRGGFDPTNKHYWGSVIWLGIWGYVIGVFWLLVGVLWALATCCYFCCCRSKTAKTSGYSRGYYCCPAVVVILLSAIALAGAALTFYGESTFRRDSRDTRDFVLLTAANTTADVRNVTGTLSAAQNVITEVSPSEGQTLQDVITSLNNAADDVDRKVNKNKKAVDTGLKVVDIVLIVVASCQIFIVVVALFALWFKWSFLLLPIIILSWLFCVFGWIVAGVWFSVYHVTTDTCTAMHEYTLDPTNTTLDTILPCVDRTSAQNTLRTARRSVNRLVNATNGQITTLNAQLASGGATTVLPFVCLPYGGEPDYPPIPCPSGQVDPLQLSTAIQAYRCTGTDVNTCALAGTPLTPSLYTLVEPVVGAITNISRSIPTMVELATCQFVTDAFNHLVSTECPKLREDVIYITVAFTTASSALLFLCIGWFVVSRRALRVKRTNKFHTEGYEYKDQFGQPVAAEAPFAPNRVARV